MLKLNIDNQSLVVSESVINSLLSLITVKAQDLINEKLPPLATTFMEQFARKQLYDLEKRIFAESGDKELAKQVRPSKNQSPMEKAIELFLPIIKEMLQRVEVRLSTDDNDYVSHISIELTNTSKAG